MNYGAVAKGICPQCEFIEYDPDLIFNHWRKCSEDARRYVREDGKRLDIIKGGKIHEGSKKKINLCEEHYREMKTMIPSLVEVQ